MGKRQRLIVQADLTSEEDAAFVAWVKEKRRRRRLAEEIRLGLRLQYERTVLGGAVASPSPPTPPAAAPPVRPAGEEDQDQLSAGDKLKTLVQSF